MIEVNLKVNFTRNRDYKSFLSRLKKLGLLLATVGIHEQEGKQKIYRRYTAKNKKGKMVTRISGKSYRMTVAKLAYQNELGTIGAGGSLPNIRIRPRYGIVKAVSKKVRHYQKEKHTIKTTTKYSALRGAREQGYLIKDKQGKFVAYFPPDKEIKIPPRPFLSPICKNPPTDLAMQINSTIKKILIDKTLNPKQGFNEIAKITELKIKQNMRNIKPSAHPVTRKAKGFNLPLVDEKDRLTKAIKYKVYNNPYKIGSRDAKRYSKQFEAGVEKLLKSAEQYEKIAMEITEETKVKVYKGLNPNFNFKW